jgi:RNA polymerase sigma-70 factor (ECF subfamily)
MNDNEDAVLVARTLQGDPRAFASLVDAYQRVLFNVTLRMVNNFHDAQDIVQTTFVKTYEKLHTYDPKRKFFSWIYRIAVNECLNHLNRRKPTEDLVFLPESEGSPDEATDQEQVGAMVGLALLELSPDHRGVIILRHFIHLSHREMGRVLELPERTVKSRLHTARKALGNVLIRQGAGRA